MSIRIGLRIGLGTKSGSHGSDRETKAGLGSSRSLGHTRCCLIPRRGLDTNEAVRGSSVRLWHSDPLRSSNTTAGETGEVDPWAADRASRMTSQQS
jgi:hypothetical protein